MPKLNDADLRDLVVKRRDASFKHVTGELARARREAIQFYNGDNLDLYGDSGDGLSTVVSRDTMEAVESMMPSLVKPFVAGDEVVRFEPTGPEDEDGARQATEYVNYLFANHNDAFRVIYDSMKDGLLFRYGVAKVVHETVTDTTFERYQGLDDAQLAALKASKDYQIVGEPEQDESGYSVQVQRDQPRSMFRVYVIAPEEFLYEDRLASLDDGTFFAHHAQKPVGDLIAMGLPADKCRSLQSGTPGSIDGDLSRDVRFDGDDRDENLGDDDLARKVWVDECYVRVDYDGSGTLRWRKIVMGGADNTILLNEEADDHPFEGWTPIPMPHKLVGLSIADLTRDVQMQKTATVREVLNAMYLANRPQREVVADQVNIDDLLSPTVGGVVRVKSPGMIRELPSGGRDVAAGGFQLIEYLDATRESRTGVTRYNQGLDANSLNKTATGVSIISNASMQRQELIARQYAESFLKGVFKKLLGLVSRYQDKAAVVRLRGEWVEMDPSEWKTGYDMSVAVGLGTGNKDQMVAQITNLLSIDQEIIGLQGGLNGPLLTAENVFEKLKRMVEAMGLKGVERYYTDPKPKEGEGPQQQAPEGPSPEQQQADQQAQAAQAQQEAEMQRHAAELDQKHQTAVEVARIGAESAEEVARINAEKDILIAGLQVPADLLASDDNTAEPEPQEQPMPEPEYVPDGAPVQEGDDASFQLDPDTLAALQAHFAGQDQQQGQTPPDDVPPGIEL